MAHTKKRFVSVEGFESNAPDVNTNSSHSIAPGGTDSQRPTNPGDKAWRVNTQGETVEIYVNNRWVPMASESSMSDIEDTSFFYAIMMSK